MTGHVEKSKYVRIRSTSHNSALVMEDAREGASMSGGDISRSVLKGALSEKEVMRGLKEAK